jgi:hypothetical protein
MINMNRRKRDVDEFDLGKRSSKPIELDLFLPG